MHSARPSLIDSPSDLTVDIMSQLVVSSAAAGRRSSEKLDSPFLLASSKAPRSSHHEEDDTAARFAVLENSQRSITPVRRRSSYRTQLLLAESRPAMACSIPAVISIGGRNRSSARIPMVDDSSGSAASRRSSNKSRRRSVKKRMSQLRDEALQEEGEILTMAQLASQCLEFAAGGCEDGSRKVTDIV